MNLQISSFNTRGLGEHKKRRCIFQWLKRFHKGICLLQETHSTLTCEEQWLREWDGTIIFNHGTNMSKGVAIVIPKSMEFTINKQVSDNNGRILLLDIDLGDQNLILVNVYAPTKDKEKEQIDFIDVLRTMLEEYNDRNIVIGGDFNTYLDPNLDKKGGLIQNLSNYANFLKAFNEEFNLIDSYRTLQPDSLKYTWRGKTRNGLVQSRLDYIFISTHMIYDLDNVLIDPSVKSDHSIITVNFNIHQEHTRGKGFWKFNSSLLKSKEYIEIVKNVLDNCKNKYINFENKTLLWDVIKCEIRSETISYAAWASKKRKEEIEKLRNALIVLEININNGENVFNEYQETKLKLEGMMQAVADGVFIRSRAKFIEDNEKSTKYFLQLEKRNNRTKSIRTLITENGSITDPQKILDEQRLFYKNLYTKSSRDKCDKDCSFFNANIPQLDEIDKNNCEKLITIEECGIALQSLPNNKAPGSDGFNTEFFKFFWTDIKHLVFDSFAFSFKSEMLSIDQKRALLTLLPKPGKDLRYLKNWRPLSLLNTDYKILTKLLSIRLQKVIPNLVSEDQVGYIKGRQLGENCRKIIDIFENTENKVDPGFALFLDFEKAFDTVSWDFLFDTLKAFNFGNEFIKWIKIIYKQPLCSVTNNGHAAESFETSRGIRQGCPISALLFVLVAELMSIAIRQDPGIKGLTFNNTIITITQMADDTTLFLKDLNSVQNCLKILHHFSKCAGLKLNTDKTEAFQLGLKSQLIKAKFGLKWVNGPIKVTGIWVGNNIQSLSVDAIKEKIQKLKVLLNMWKMRNLSIKGKITLLRSQAMPIFLYLASILYVPTEYIKKVDELFFDFVWPKGKHHVKKKVLIQDIESGGLKMPDVEAMIKSIKLTWIKKIAINNSSFASLAKSMMSIDNFKQFIQYKNDSSFLNSSMPNFYKQLFHFWYELHSRPPNTPNEILNEIIWNNKRIIRNGRPIPPGIYNLHGISKVGDLLNMDGKFLTVQEINQIYAIEIEVLMYNGIKCAIPKQWMSKINSISMQNWKTSNTIDLKINFIQKDFFKLKCKQLYSEFIILKSERPSALYKWEELYYYAELDWKHIFRLPYTTARETTLQSFQYQIINRYIPCRNNLHLWRKEPDNLCVECKEIDTIEHYLYKCQSLNNFWSNLKTILYNAFNINMQLSTLDVIFGILNENNSDPVFDAINFCILFAKYFIHICKTQSDPIDFAHFKIKIKERLAIEQFLHVQNEKLTVFENKWLPLYNIL